jgi:hypothetical protein
MARLACTYGEVAEWLKAADCKSARASVRWFESSPLHHCSPEDWQFRKMPSLRLIDRTPGFACVINIGDTIILRKPKGGEGGTTSGAGDHSGDDRSGRFRAVPLAGWRGIGARLPLGFRRNDPSSICSRLRWPRLYISSSSALSVVSASLCDRPLITVIIKATTNTKRNRQFSLSRSLATFLRKGSSTNSIESAHLSSGVANEISCRLCAQAFRIPRIISRFCRWPLLRIFMARAIARRCSKLLNGPPFVNWRRCSSPAGSSWQIRSSKRSSMWVTRMMTRPRSLSS